jgi:hypothetical protein
MAIKETTFIELGGKKLPIKMGINTTALYLELKGVDMPQYYKDILQLIQVGNMIVLRDILYCSIKDGCRVEKQEFTEDNIWVGDMMDEMDAGQLKKFLLEVYQSLPKSDDKTDEEGDEKKKAQ